MRIIHTSDWHLGSFWNTHDRKDQLFGQVNRVCEIVRERNADVLLVAGDIFERVRRDRLLEVTQELARRLKPIVESGVHVVLVPGNHDLREHFGVMKYFLELETGKSNRVHVAEGYEKFEIDGVQFVAVPYPDHKILEKFGDYKPAEKLGKEERNRSLSNSLADFFRRVNKDVDASRPAVLVTHIQIYGVKPSDESDIELHYDNDICVAHELLPTNFAYIALGHIHQCQKIKHSVPTWYCGSFDRMNLGERKDEKCVLLVEVNSTAKATVERIPIEATKFDDIKVKSSELESFAESYPERDKTFVRLTVECEAGDVWFSVLQTARELFPLHSEIIPTGDIFKPVVINLSNNPAENPKATVIEHLEQQFADDADLAELVELFETELWEAASNAITAN